MSVVELGECRNGVRRLTLSRPDAMNTVNRELIGALTEALDEVRRDERCRVLVLTGAGRAFCAGLDLRGYGDDELVAQQGAARRMLDRQREIAHVVQLLHTLPQVVVAAVNGAAAGAGLALVLASDIRIAATGVVFAVSFIRAGYSACDLGTSWLLPRIVGAGRAHELMLTGRRFHADEALAIGLLASVVAPGDLLATAEAKAHEVQLNPPMSVALTKQGMWSALETPSFDAVVEFENRQQVLTAFTEDQAEASRAFLEKRAPVYRNR